MMLTAAVISRTHYRNLPGTHAITSMNNSSTNLYSGKKLSVNRIKTSCFPLHLAALPHTVKPSKPMPYQADLTPIPSALRPHCLAKERLRFWRPRTTQPLGPPGSETDLARILDVMSHAWEEGTRESYGSGLLVFHVFCDKKGVPEHDRAPVSQLLLSTFISHLAGSYSGKTLKNYFYGICAWHILHRTPWHLNEPEMDVMLTAAAKLTPPKSKRKKRRPYTVAYIEKLKTKLDLTVPLDAAVFACLTTCFYAAARVGEFTVGRIDGFDCNMHPARSDIKADQDRNGLQVTVLRIPRTKTSHEGEEVSWSRQHGPTDPYNALELHLTLNDPPADGHIFAYKWKHGTYRPLTKTTFIKRLSTAARAAGEDPLQGHGIRIGSTLEYLLRGVPFDVMKVIGRWASDAFILYLRKHAQILAPYLQAVPNVHQSFIRLTMPTITR